MPFRGSFTCRRNYVQNPIASYPAGYDELCEIHEKKASHKRLTRDEKERLEWYANTGEGKDYDPELFDIDACIEAVDMLNDYSRGDIS